MTRPGPVEDFWSTSTGEMDNSAVQSQGSISSISTSNQTFDPHNNGSTSNPAEFVNHGKSLSVNFCINILSKIMCDFHTYNHWTTMDVSEIMGFQHVLFMLLRAPVNRIYICSVYGRTPGVQ